MGARCKIKRQSSPRAVSSFNVSGPLVCRAYALLPTLALAILLVVGCGPRSDRLQVSGEVTLDGEPLSGGAIRFTSVESEKIVASGAMIENGKFLIPQEKGLTPGKYHLEINAPDNDAPPIIVRESPGGPGIPTQPERIPPEYNVNSDKTIEVTAESDNHFVFNIQRRPAT